MKNMWTKGILNQNRSVVGLIVLCGLALSVCGCTVPSAINGGSFLTTETQSPSSFPDSSVPDAGQEPETNLGAYTWEPYCFDRLAEEYAQDAARLADAILSYLPSVSLSADRAEVLVDNFAFEFPPAALVNLSVDGDAVAIAYIYPEEIHQQQIAAFRSSVNRALGLISEGDSEYRRAELLYDYVVENVEYYYTDYTDKDITAFSALTAGKTICYGFADAFGYLLRQTGIEAHLWRGGTQTWSGFSEHGWCYAKIDGAYYHFDPTWEYSAAKSNQKNGHIYFGLSDGERFTSLSRKCVSGFGALEVVCNTSNAPNALK